MTAGDSQVQLLSVDAFKYATQSPPLTMITKTIPNRRQSNTDNERARVIDFAADPHEAVLNSEPQADDLESTRPVITPAGFLNKDQLKLN